MRVCLINMFLFWVAVTTVRCQWGHEKNWEESPFSPPGAVKNKQKGIVPQQQKIYGGRHPNSYPQPVTRKPRRNLQQREQGTHVHGHDHYDPNVPQTHGHGGKKEKCGKEEYIPRTSICCQGTLHRRQGIRPACCGTRVYDFVFGICCKGHYKARTLSHPQCLAE